MSNKDNKVADKKEEQKVVDHKAKWNEAKENLLIQLKESLEQVEFHGTRATKIRGVIEVNEQLFQEENEQEN